MNIEEYKQKLLDIRLNAEKEENHLIREYALTNNPVSIGDTIEDHIGKGLVEGVAVTLNHYGDRLPLCVYRCLELTKKRCSKEKSY